MKHRLAQIDTISLNLYMYIMQKYVSQNLLENPVENKDTYFLHDST